MTSRIEDYALIGDTITAALVGRDGSIDWFCVPRFDSGACFAALLGTPEHGRWLLAPAARPRRTSRRYRTGTLVLETQHETDDGAVTVVDCMPFHEECADIQRLVVGERGEVRMRMQLIIRFDYGGVIPWVRRLDGALVAVAGPDALEIWTEVPLRGEGYTTVAEFTVRAGQRIPFSLTWHPSHRSPPERVDPERALKATERWWQDWSARYRDDGPWRDAVLSSLILLKALTFAPTGGIVAAPTTSLPEEIGGVRNWDYRYCWLRDATFTLYALLMSGYTDEAAAWRDWLLRAVAGNTDDLQIMYGLGGERRLTELELGWLPGYEGSRPVRIGNGAYLQRQLDVYGEVLDALHVARRAGIEMAEASWDMQRAMVGYLEAHWTEPDEGIWEVRGPPRHFTHSKVMAWVAVDRAIKAVERFGVKGPVERWRALREEIHGEVCHQGFDAERGAFVQYYGGKRLDASLLMIPLVGFLPVTDPRVRSTVEAIERELTVGGLVRRYIPAQHVEGVHGGEGMFLACTFWLADTLALLGRQGDARRLFERVLALRNDVGLLAEQYDPVARRMLGNFPQAFSHVSLINTARNLSQAGGPAEDRPSDSGAG
jgi:GH15 family glucan-1,4-alpha-glucosidase